MDAKINLALTAIESVLSEDQPIIVAYSGGKDSSVVLNLTITAAKRCLAKYGKCPPIIIIYADTGIENPEIASYVSQELEKIVAYGKSSGLNLTVEVAEPPLNSRWAVRVLGGRGLPVFPSSAGSQRDCTIDFKVRPMQRLRKKIFSGFNQSQQNPVTVIGTRFDESPVRSRRMKGRGESCLVPWQGQGGELFLSPIAQWSAEGVWFYISECMDGRIKSYSDFRQTFKLYAHAAGSSCAIEADIALGGQKISRAGCGSRFGCVLCTATDDKSMKNMLGLDEYAFMKEVHQLQQFILKTQYDFNRRTWVGRSINKHGYIAIGPDVYSPAMLLELLRYCLTIDVLEKERAAQLARAPRFELVSARELIAIDAMWSLQGYHRPFSALREYRDIYVRGHRYPVPDVKRFPRIPIPATRYYHVGKNWDEQIRRFSGFRDPVLEVLGGSGCMDTKTLKDGRIVFDVQTKGLFEVDEEAANCVLKLDLDYLIDRAPYAGARYSNGYLHHVIAGYLIPAKGKEGIIDNILRRTAFKERHGLAGEDYNLNELLAKSVSKAEMEQGLLRSVPKTIKFNCPGLKKGQLPLPFDTGEAKVA